MDNQYHRMRVPEWLRTYLGLPGVQREGHTVYPVINSMPMGWSHSVYVAQNMNLQILRNAGLPIQQWITKSIVVKEFTFGAYVDDYFSLGASREQAEKHLEAVIRESKESGLPSKPEKVSWPGKEDYTEVLGIELHSNGNLFPKACKIKELISQTKEFEQRRWWTTRGLQSIIGKWAWFILLRRPLFSIFQKVYELTARDSQSVPAKPEARGELRLIVEMSPLIRASLGRMFSEVVLCTDASLISGGFVYCRTSFALTLCEAELEEQHNWIRKQKWNIAIRHKWRESLPIHILEGEALILTLRWLLRSRANHGKRVIIFVDNQALISALQKGRSRVRSFNRICRRVASLPLVDNRIAELFYVPSALNPADGPSRLV